MASTDRQEETTTAGARETGKERRLLSRRAPESVRAGSEMARKERGCLRNGRSSGREAFVGGQVEMERKLDSLPVRYVWYGERHTTRAPDARSDKSAAGKMTRRFVSGHKVSVVSDERSDEDGNVRSGGKLEKWGGGCRSNMYLIR